MVAPGAAPNPARCVTRPSALGGGVPQVGVPQRGCNHADTVALAASPHIVGSPTTTVSGNSLILSASVAGLGNVPSATFSLEGTVDVSSRCYTKSGNKPQAANKQESINVSQTKTFDVRNGRTNATLHRDAALDADLPR